jgi:two-component system LytT family sensor kinase
MNTGQLFDKYRGWHLLGWALLFLGWYFFRMNDFPSHAVVWKVMTVRVVGLAILVYTTNYLLIPGLLYKRKYLLFLLVYLPMIFGMGLLKMYLIERLLSPFYRGGFEMFDNFKARVYDNIIPAFLLTSTFAGARLVFDYLTTQKKLADISREKAETELKFLKSQINPHFLFNSLNSIYFLIDKQNADARQTLLQFSDLLRYQLYECSADTIPIENEIAYLEDYIRLQQLRRDSHYETAVRIDAVHGFRVVPLLFIPFVENAFKHLSHYSNGRKNFVEVELTRTGNALHFQVQNSREEQERRIEPGGGIGLINVRRRLELLYPGKYHLQIDHNETTFTVALQLDIL